MKLFLILVTFLLILGCKGPKEKHNNSDLTIEIEGKNCVNQVLKRDSVFGEIRNHASENISLSETINNYTNDLKSIDYINCPEKFKSAFHAHIEAWLEIIKVSDKYPSLRGELHDIFAKLEKSEDSTEFKLLVKQIWDTWKIVEVSSK